MRELSSMPNRIKARIRKSVLRNFARGKVYTRVGPQEGVDLRHKVGIDMQEGIVEHIIEFAALFFNKFSRFRHAVQFIRLTGRKFFRRFTFANWLSLTYIYRAQLHELTDIHFCIICRPEILLQ